MLQEAQFFRIFRQIRTVISMKYKKYQQGTVSNYTRNFKIEIYLRYRNEKDRKLFGLKDVSEYFSSKLYKYVIGVVNLETLYGLRQQLPEMDVFIVNTGRKVNK